MRFAADERAYHTGVELPPHYSTSPVKQRPKTSAGVFGADDGIDAGTDRAFTQRVPRNHAQIEQLDPLGKLSQQQHQ